MSQFGSDFERKASKPAAKPKMTFVELDNGLYAPRINGFPMAYERVFTKEEADSIMEARKRLGLEDE